MEQNELFDSGLPKQQRLDLSGEDPAPAEPLDLPQRFEEASSFEVRDELQALIERDLLGPWNGPLERFSPKAMGPRERYLVGMLGPKHEAVSTRDQADEVPDTETGVAGDGSEAELPEVTSPQALGRIWASSMGLSFCVPADVDVLSVTAEWGRYAETEEETEEGKKVRAWSREPVAYEREVRLDAEPSYRIPLTAQREDAPGVLLAVTVRSRDERQVVEISLINGQRELTGRAGDTAWLFQPRLTVTALDGAAPVFLPIDDPADDLDTVGDDAEELHLRLLYRNQRRYAAGRNVAVYADAGDGERVARRLTTTWLPTYDVPATIAPNGPGTPLEHVELSMDALATAGPDALEAGLRPLIDGYTAWLDAREAEIPSLPEPLRPAATRAVYDARQAARRIEAGVTLLTDPADPYHGDALTAFHFANETMARQRRHTALAKLRDDEGLTYEQARTRIEARGASAASWRPFQLAFILLNLPSLTDPGHPERAADHTALVDLLFFPTGGGKTEAYLGLTAYTFAIRRLQGILGAGEDARSGEAGVAVLMRYTLRLLTAQQFQRAAALICAAEVLRRDDPATWGDEPFRIGLWVGAGVSPNWFDEGKDQVIDARDAGQGNRANVLQTLSCPWCGEELRAERDLDIDEPRRRILLYCPRGEGIDACPFSRRMSPREGLPILTVDEEIYRYAPSLVIATVDKLAQLPWKGYAGMLFGRVSRRCPRHGYRHDDMDDKTGCASRHQAKDGLPAVTTQPVVRLRPPDLIIQDELHLISGALGTTVGLFESAVAELTSWPYGPGRTGPKIVASTATTKRARQQVLGVFGRDLAIFPPQVSDVADTFFSRQVTVTPETPGRRYLGVCAHGVRLKSAEIRLAEILLLAGQTLFDRYGAAADPYMTMVGYFNATRELAGMRRYLDDDVTTRVRRHGRAKGLSDRIVTRSGMLTVQELTSRISSGDISDVLKRLEHGFDPELDTARRRYACQAELARVSRDRRTARSNEKVRPPHPVAQRYGDRRRDELEPVDAVLATSMLQVGVDVSRFGLMVLVGQPKNTAEYIQASSRVGRDAERPGLVVTLYNWSRPRDLAHYEDFAYYHATFYRQVEALSVTPYTRRAIDRGAAATFVAAVRQIAEDASHNHDAYDVDLDGPLVTELTERLLDRAEAVAAERGRDHLADSIKVIKDTWARERDAGSVRLGYQDGTWNKQQLRGLLQPAGNGRWQTMTAGMSMRETENEINLLFPGGDAIFTPTYGEPAWSFESSGEDGDLPDGDELGDSELTGKNGR
ncbi:DISARM system helicase DrmA [Actinoallomurus spadix]|uniref:DISARM system helicase DrmA n=1 Tax=Actinoallomurus spadix TaxID=79912 RepID=A0ABN0WI80_9ACTN|nr:DISARM system helicase DrmA [Actinoallomurus spadix]MCO5989928.1 DISARM system helicase DrmA [Actinoallomurus spadix]